MPIPLIPIIVGIGAGLTGLSLLGAAIYCCCFRRAPVDDRGIYRCLNGDRAFAANVQQVANWINSPGGRTINGQVLGGLNHGNVLAFSNRFHDTLAHHDLWTWNPFIPGEWEGHGCRVADGDINAGECAMLAQALFVLLTYPNPYGFNEDAGNFEVRQYHGANNHGFIVRHQNAPFHLDANIYNVGGHRVDYYLWSNHKTLRYNGRFYDPSYGTSQGGQGFYANEDAMATAQIQGDIDFGEDQFQGEVLVDSVVMTDNTAPVALKGFYIAVVRSIVDGHLAADADELMANMANFRKAYIGPFNPAGARGNTGNQFGFDNTIDYLHGINLG